MGKSSIKRYHHFVPKLYLKGFVQGGNTSFIWAYEKNKGFNPGLKRGKNNPYRSSVNKVGGSKGYYAYKTKSGPLDFNTFENILEKQEKSADPIIAKIRKMGILTDQEKKSFSSYIALMIKRVPQREDLLKRIYYQKMNEFPWDALQVFFQEHGQFGKAHETIRLKEAYLAKPDKEIILSGMVIPSKQVPKALLQMKWIFCVAPPNKPFVTSDSPAAYPQKIGLGKKDSVLVFPISSMIALFATREGVDREYLNVTSEHVDSINQITMTNAHNFLYCREAERTIVEKWKSITSNNSL